MPLVWQFADTKLLNLKLYISVFYCILCKLKQKKLERGREGQNFKHNNSRATAQARASLWHPTHQQMMLRFVIFSDFFNCIHFTCIQQLESSDHAHTLPLVLRNNHFKHKYKIFLNAPCSYLKANIRILQENIPGTGYASGSDLDTETGTTKPRVRLSKFLFKSKVPHPFPIFKIKKQSTKL